ncbi:MAG: LysM peptidoglycan-binding domain-containing protein [Anaerolineae bacterium]|nr:LysM peptidoglycan-binding domain-containing protein [Anaerolineae bacterium]
MRQSIWWLIGLILLAGCGQVLTPSPQAIPKVQQIVPSPVAVTPAHTPQSTSTPRPATPRSTPTPTVSPTPVIYVVQSGDTLLDIAIRFERTTEAIQEANGIIDPRFLQIGQELIIPPPQDSPDNPPTPTSTPPPLLVEAVNFQQTQQGTLWCLGQVSNPGSDSLSEVVVEAALYDEGGVLLAREAAFTQLDVVRPEQAVPFAILFDTPPRSFAQYQVMAVSGVPVSEQARYYFDLEAFDLHGSQVDIATYRLDGQLRNGGPLDAEAIRLVAVVYDEAGRVLAQRQAELAVELLRAGAITPFTIDLILTHGVVDHYEVLVQGLEAQ